jgi:hypothetical protein
MQDHFHRHPAVLAVAGFGGSVAHWSKRITIGLLQYLAFIAAFVAVLIIGLIIAGFASLYVIHGIVWLDGDRLRNEIQVDRTAEAMRNDIEAGRPSGMAQPSDTANPAPTAHK